MAVKGNAIELNDRALEVATFLTNKLVKDIEPRLQNIEVQKRKLEEEGVESLKGGRGEDILSALNSAIKHITQVKENTQAISKFLDTKLASVMEAIKDRDDIAATAANMQKTALEAKLRK